MKGLVPSLCATPPTLLYQRVRPPFRGACTPCFTVIPSGRAGGGPEIPETEAARLEDERESERSADRICASTHGMDPAGVKDEEGVSKALQFGVNVTADPGKKEMLVPSHVPALPYAVGRDIFADPLVDGLADPLVDIQDAFADPPASPVPAIFPLPKAMKSKIPGCMTFYRAGEVDSHPEDEQDNTSSEQQQQQQQEAERTEPASEEADKQEAEEEVKELLNHPDEVIHEMQAQPWGADVSPEYVHAIVDVVTHPDEVLHGMDIGSHEQQHKGEEEDTLQQQEQQQQQQQYQQSEGDSAHKVSTIPGLENKEMWECMDFFQERTGMTSEEFIRSLKAPPARADSQGLFADNRAGAQPDQGSSSSGHHDTEPKDAEQQTCWPQAPDDASGGQERRLLLLEAVVAEMAVVRGATFRAATLMKQFNRWPQELKRALQSGQPPAQQAGGAEKNASPRNQLQQCVTDLLAELRWSTAAGAAGVENLSSAFHAIYEGAPLPNLPDTEAFREWIRAGAHPLATHGPGGSSGFLGSPPHVHDGQDSSGGGMLEQGAVWAAGKTREAVAASSGKAGPHSWATAQPCHSSQATKPMPEQQHVPPSSPALAVPPATTAEAIQGQQEQHNPHLHPHPTCAPAQQLLASASAPGPASAAAAALPAALTTSHSPPTPPVSCVKPRKNPSCPEPSSPEPSSQPSPSTPLWHTGPSLHLHPLPSRPAAADPWQTGPSVHLSPSTLPSPLPASLSQAAPAPATPGQEAPSLPGPLAPADSAGLPVLEKVEQPNPWGCQEPADPWPQSFRRPLHLPPMVGSMGGAGGGGGHGGCGGEGRGGGKGGDGGADGDGGEGGSWGESSEGGLGKALLCTLGFGCLATAAGTALYTSVRSLSSRQQQQRQQQQDGRGSQEQQRQQQQQQMCIGQQTQVLCAQELQAPGQQELPQDLQQQQPETSSGGAALGAWAIQGPVPSRGLAGGEKQQWGFEFTQGGGPPSLPGVEVGAGDGVSPGQEPVEVPALLEQARAANTATTGSVPVGCLPGWGLDGKQQQQQQQQQQPQQEQQARLAPQQAAVPWVQAAREVGIEQDEARLRDDIINDLVQWEAPGTEATVSHVTGAGLHPARAVWLNLEDTYDAAGGALVAFFDAAGRTVSSVGGRALRSFKHMAAETPPAPTPSPKQHQPHAVMQGAPAVYASQERQASEYQGARELPPGRPHISDHPGLQPAHAPAACSWGRTARAPSRQELMLLFGLAGLTLSVGGLLLGKLSLLPFTALALPFSHQAPRNSGQAAHSDWGGATQEPMSSCSSASLANVAEEPPPARLLQHGLGHAGLNMEHLLEQGPGLRRAKQQASGSISEVAHELAPAGCEEMA